MLPEMPQSDASVPPNMLRTDPCYRFVWGTKDKNEFFSPGFEDKPNYTNNTNCVRVLTGKFIMCFCGSANFLQSIDGSNFTIENFNRINEKAASFLVAGNLIKSRGSRDSYRLNINKLNLCVWVKLRYEKDT